MPVGSWPVWGWALAGGGAGAIAGSFLATIALRWPQGRSVAAGRSQCDACGAALRWFELVPLASFLAAFGRCRRCGGAIDRRHLAIELAAALIGAASLGVVPGPAGIAGALFGWILLTLGALDLEHYWLPDALTLPLLALGLGIGASGLHPLPLDRLAGAAAGYAALALIDLGYRLLRGRIGIGGGDAKLLGAVGGWLGWQALPLVVFGAAIGGLVLVAIGLVRRRPVSRFDRVPLGTLLAAEAWFCWLIGSCLA